MIIYAPVTEENRAAANAFLRERWGGTQMAVRDTLLDLSEADGFAALEDGALCGLVTYAVSGDACEITSLGSARERRGVGSGLLERAVDAARGAGCAWVTLITTNDNTEALRFYQRRGFEIAAVRRGAVTRARKTLRPSIPERGEGGIPIEHEIELELALEAPAPGRRGVTRREREVTDPAQIRDILERSRVVHLGLSDRGEAYVLPMNYGVAIEDGRYVLYVHGALKGRKYEVLRREPRVSFEMECGVAPFEGSIACRYGTSYSCVMGRGTASFVEDPAGKARALSVIMKTQTGKDFEFTERMVSVVNVVRIEVEELTAKRRPAPEPQTP